MSRRNKSTSEFSVNLTCLVSPKEIEWGHGRNPVSLKGIEIFAVYKYKEGKLRLLKTSEYLEIALDPFDYELFVVSPVKVLSRKLVQYAPIGLVNMLNSGGAIQSLGCDHVEGIVRVGVKGSGEMKIFASEKPRSCTINRLTVDFSYNDHVVVVQVPWPDSSDLSVIEYVF